MNKQNLRQALVRLAVVSAVPVFSVGATASPVNLGFEEGVPGAAPSDWVVTHERDGVRVVAEEGPSDFHVYQHKGTVVSPADGANMLRLKRPRTILEAQPKGSDRVTQTFSSTSDRLGLRLRVFSWEYRSGQDEVIVNLVDPSNSAAEFPVGNGLGGGFQLPMPNGHIVGCSQTPCRLKIDVGSIGQYLDSDWLDLEISGLPDDGRLLELSYEVKTPSSYLKPTWAYFDNANEAPEARFNFNPGSEPGTVALEGDALVFDCKGTEDAPLSVDPDGDPITCTWLAEGPGLAQPLTAEGDLAIFVFPDDGTIQVTLTVSDGELSDTVVSGTEGIASVDISNGDPIASALGVQVAAGGKAPLFCRFVDPGVADSHTMEIMVNGNPQTVAFRFENNPSLSSGSGEALLDAAALGLAAGSTYGGNCTVTDGDGGYAVAPFEVEVLSAVEIAALELSDTNQSAGAPICTSGMTHLGLLDAPGDVDVCEIRLPDNLQLPANGEVYVTVTVPTDYDAILFSRNSSTESSPFLNAPFLNAPFLNAPFLNVPFLNVPFLNATYDSVPFLNAPFLNAPFLNAPFLNAPLKSSPFLNAGYEFANFPLTQVGLVAPNGSGITQSDVTLSDLGSQSLGALAAENLEVKAISANLGTDRERMLVRVAPGQQALYLAVVAQGGSFSSAPFSFSLEVYEPLSQNAILGANCDGELLVASGEVAGETLLRGQGNPKTLVITQMERLQATFGLDAAERAQFLADMEPFFAHPSVQARVISVPSSIYDTGDLDTCDISRQNDVSTAIRTIIQRELAADSSIEFVQILGGIDIVPARFVPDETGTGNESLYTSDLFVLPGKPLAVGFGQSFNITDAYYVDEVPQPFRGRELYIEDVSISRMVERPEEILGEAQRFLIQDGMVDFGNALATGYDFFIDGTDQTASVLSAAVPTTVYNDDFWTADQLRCDFFGVGDTSCATRDFCAVNAHMTYNAAISAVGYSTLDFNEVIASVESAGVRDGKLTLSIGCHSGLNVPDAWAFPPGSGLPFDPARDWVQELGTWIGPWGYGLGDDTVADRGTEGLVTLVAQELLKGESLGVALINAKQRYALGLFDFDEHDEDSLINLGLFGVPQAIMAGTAGSTSALSAMATAGPSTATASTTTGSFLLTVVEDGEADRDYTGTLLQNSNADGTWFELTSLDAPAGAQAIVGRPLLPVIRPIELRTVGPGETRIHSVALRGGTYSDLPNEDPVFGLAVHDWILAGQPEPCVKTLSPTLLAVSSTFESRGTTRQSLVVQPSQFKCTFDPSAPDAIGDRVLGDFRLFDTLTVEALHPSTPALDTDYIPPQVITQELVLNPATNVVTATLEVTDASGVREISALIFDDALGTINEVTTGDLGGAPGVPVQQVLVLPDANNKRIAIQYIDRAGNLALKSLKGELLEAIPVEILATVLIAEPDSALQVRIATFADLIRPELTIDFGDGTAGAYELVDADGNPSSIVEVDPDGSALVTVPHDYSGATGSLTVVATVRALGAIGTDSATLSFCSDPRGDISNPDGDIVQCGYRVVSGTQVEIDLFVDGEISSHFFYKVYLPESRDWIIWKNGYLYAKPRRTPVSVTRISSDGSREDGLRFSFDAARIGWDGVSGLRFYEVTKHAHWWYWWQTDVTDTYEIRP